MENLAHKTEISSTILGTVADMRLFSFEEKKHASQAENDIENDTDILLDAILDIKQKLINQTETIHLFNTKIEKLTWHNDLEDDNLLLINDLIACMKDAYSSLIRQYNTLNTLKRKKIAKNEIKSFKNAIDELKETYQDLESVFFFLPAMPDFKDTTKQLSLI